MMFGIFLVMASSQHLAENLNIPSHHFTIRHILYGALSIPIIIFFSILNERQTKIICIVGITITIATFCYFIWWRENKGAQRWFFISGFSFQPSEIGKPLYVVFNAWLLSLWAQKLNFWLDVVNCINSFNFIIIIVTAWLRNDYCNVFTWGFNYLLQEYHWLLLYANYGFLIFMIFSYQYFDHVKIRIDNFIEGKTHQVSKSLQSFESGGFGGKVQVKVFIKNLCQMPTQILFLLWLPRNMAH